ncbi:MAG: hypothetical protein JO097_21030, partial [Acidobacteriaceae bacterium]|nr:hypothetical protein [Acidobacteriaceae bacterium]MBV9295894.1 hypothetical protein [Acidobacteriaceae bacterium]
MITTVDKDDLAAWYRFAEPVGNISIHDFEFDDDDFSLEDLLDPETQREEPVETNDGGIFSSRAASSGTGT